MQNRHEPTERGVKIRKLIGEPFTTANQDTSRLYTILKSMDIKNEDFNVRSSTLTT